MKTLLNNLGLKEDQFEIYDTALTHASYANEHNVNSNERLEFLGDAVLEVLISEYFYQTYQDLDEGKLTKKRAQAVCEQALVIYAEAVDLPKYIRLGRGLEESGANHAIVADAFEALLGAIYVSSGIEMVRKVFLKVIVPHLEDVFESKDYKSLLQEIIQGGDKRNISYSIISETGPSHKKMFEAVVKLDQKINLGTGKGKTKKEAEQRAAKDALKKGNYDFKTIS